MQLQIIKPKIKIKHIFCKHFNKKNWKWIIFNTNSQKKIKNKSYSAKKIYNSATETELNYTKIKTNLNSN